MIGPRQIAGASRSIRSPSDISLTPCAIEGLDLAAYHRGTLVHPEHPRDVGPVHVGVHHPDLKACLHQGHGQVRRDGGFPYPALAGGDREDLSQVGLFYRLRGRRDLGAGPGAWGRPVRRLRGTGGIGDVDLDIVAPDPLDSRHRRAGRAHQRGGVLGSEQEGKADLAFLTDVQVPDHAGRQKVVFQPGVLDAGQRGRHARLEGLGQG